MFLNRHHDGWLAIFAEARKRSNSWMKPTERGGQFLKGRFGFHVVREHYFIGGSNGPPIGYFEETDREKDWSQQNGDRTKRCHFGVHELFLFAGSRRALNQAMFTSPTELASVETGLCTTTGRSRIAVSRSAKAREPLRQAQWGWGPGIME